MKKCTILAVAALLAGIGSVRSQTVSTFKGVVFSDYSYAVDNHDEQVKDRNEFTIRRIYFTFENQLTKNIKMRFRLESAHGGFGDTDKINPFVKHAYLEWADLIPAHKLYFGIAETNAFKNAESYWGYRSIEKTIMDLNKISFSADMGIALKGDLSTHLHHWLTVYNGTGYGSSEVDKYKKIGYSLWITPVEGLIVEGYIDYEKQDPDNGTFKYAKDYFQGSGYTTMKGFIGYRGSSVTLGAEAFVRTNKESGAVDAAGTGRTDVKKQGFSLFTSFNTPLKHTRMFVRYDSYDPNTGDNVFVSDSMNGLHDEYSLIIAGFDFTPAEHVHFMPNVLIKNFSDSDTKSDVTARLTLYYAFNSGKITI